MQRVIFKTERELLSFFRCHKGKTLYELKRLLDTEILEKINTNKGIVGHIFEGMTGRAPNSSPNPDIEELDIDLKVLPLRNGSSKERSKLKSINYKPVILL